MTQTENKNIESVVMDPITGWSYFLGTIKKGIKHQGVRKHTKNLGWMFFSRIAIMVISFIATMYIARKLGPSNYGELSYAVSFTGLFGFIASLGIEQVLYRELVKFPEKRNEILGSALVLRIMTSLIAIIICISSAFIFSPKDVSLLLIILISSTYVFSSLSFFGYEFQADTNSKLPSINSIAVSLILNILKLLVIFLDKGVIYLALLMVLEPLLYGAGYLYIRSKVYGSILNLKFKKDLAISMFKDSLPLIFVSAFYMIYSRIDQVIIKNMMGSEAVGLYDSAVRISELWYFIPNIIIAGLFPAIINSKKIKDELYYSRSKKLFLLVGGISITTALSTVFLSDEIIKVIFGNKFIAATVVLQIYVLSNIGAALNQVAQHILVTENYTKSILFSSFCGMLTNVVLCLILIKPYGMQGAALASLISYSVQFISLLIPTKTRALFFNIFRSKLKTAAL